MPLDFPENIVAEVRTSLTAMQDTSVVPAVPLFDTILGRPLRPTDPHLSAGVFAIDWNPLEWQIGQWDPAVTRYMVGIQTFVKHGDEQEGIALHTRLGKKVRVMLYRDEDLRVRLSSLSITEDGVTERIQRWGVQTQRYLSNEINNNFMFLAVTELWCETEIV